jgi:NADPH:quinone reductase-like Zn-dependent oxidoreductase
MRAIELTGPKLDAFRATTLPDPQPLAPGEVLVRLRAASMNFMDIAVATGAFPAPRFPLIPVADGAGEIAGIGDDVREWTIGQRVVPHFMPNWLSGPIAPDRVAVMRGVHLPGSLAEYIVAPATALAGVPDHLTFEQAATLPIAATAAWNAMKAGHVGKGSTVLLLGTGGVSVYAAQFAKALGARVILTSSSDEKLDRARRDLGVDETINYRDTPAWDAEALKRTEGRGADLVIDIGGEATLRQSIASASYGGVVFVIGFLSGFTPAIDILPLIVKGVTIKGNNTGSVADLREAAETIAKHRIQPVVDRTFGIVEAAEAYAHMAAGGRHFGKIALVH